MKKTNKIQSKVLALLNKNGKNSLLMHAICHQQIFFFTQTIKNLNTTHQCEYRSLRVVLAIFLRPNVSNKQLFRLIIKAPV